MKNKIPSLLAVLTLAASGYCVPALAKTTAAAATPHMPSPHTATRNPSTNRLEDNRDSWGDYVKVLSEVFFHHLEFRSRCGNKPDYKCTGIMLSGFEPQDDPYYWMTPNPYQNKLSMTYLILSTVSDESQAVYSGSGFMFWPQDELAQEMIRQKQANHAFPTVFRCIFAQDAYTYAREDSGCGAIAHPPPVKTGPCQSEGITSVQTWLDAYGKGDKFMNQCGFTLQVSPTADKASWSIVAQIQETLIAQKNTDTFGSYDEVIMHAWDSYSPERIPLLGFFYVEPDSKHYLVAKDPKKTRLTPGGDLKQVQAQQLNYYQKTKIFAPIIQISGKSWLSADFTYVPGQQAQEIPDVVNVLPQ